MAEQEFNIIPANNLPIATEAEIANGQVLIVAFGSANPLKRATANSMRGEKGDNIYLRVTSTAIQWKIGTSGAWEDLVLLETITGPKGDKILLRKGGSSIEYKYESEDDSLYRQLVSFDDIRLKFSDLTPEEIDQISLHFSDLTPEEIDKLKLHFEDLTAEDIIILQKPALDAAENANTATTAANEATQNAISATYETIEATQKTQEATEIANDINNHPWIIKDKIWWRWNHTTQKYVSTGEPARGEAGVPFKVVFHFDTLEELEAAIPDGDQVPGVVSVGLITPYSYYAWVIKNGVPSWQNQGELQGPAGKDWRVIDLDHEPTEDDTIYTDESGEHNYPVGGEVRYRDADGDITFYKLYDITAENKAIWEETGGVSLPGNVYLTGANYYNKDVQVIKGGILNGK